MNVLSEMLERQIESGRNTATLRRGNRCERRPSKGMLFARSPGKRRYVRAESVVLQMSCKMSQSSKDNRVPINAIKPGKRYWISRGLESPGEVEVVCKVRGTDGFQCRIDGGDDIIPAAYFLRECDTSRNSVDLHGLERSFASMASIKEKPCKWLWDQRIPVGELIIIDGDPSTNKSCLTIDLAGPVCPLEFRCLTARLGSRVASSCCQQKTQSPRPCISG